MNLCETQCPWWIKTDKMCKHDWQWSLTLQKMQKVRLLLFVFWTKTFHPLLQWVKSDTIYILIVLNISARRCDQTASHHVCFRVHYSNKNRPAGGATERIIYSLVFVCFEHLGVIYLIDCAFFCVLVCKVHIFCGKSSLDNFNWTFLV